MTINSSLKCYIEREILPLYLHFDKAHNLDHAQPVIEQSLKLARHFEVDIDMVYTIAAYHDLGLRAGRELHHKVSAEIMGADERLKEWFDAEQIEIMQQAVFDHRASSKEPPKSIYGRTVAEADRCIDAMTVIRRTIQFGLSHYPELTIEGHYNRCVEHLTEKYGRNGYLKLWIEESDNGARLEELRQIIEDKNKLRQLFNNIYAEEL